MKPVLQLEQVKKTFESGNGKRMKRVVAVDGVSLLIEKGETVGLIGSSGCGKTTIVRMLLGLLKPDAGTAVLRGRVGFVGQDPYATLAPMWTVGRIVAEPLLFLGKCKTIDACEAEVRRVLSLVHMDYETYAGRLPSQLSGGERQRVSIARALIVRPDFLVLDEPTSMLDEEVKDKITDVIKEITQAGEFGVLLVTHDIAMARRICGRFLVMEAGKVVEEGLAEAVFANPKAELTKNLIAVATDLKGFWAQYLTK